VIKDTNPSTMASDTKSPVPSFFCWLYNMIPLSAYVLNSTSMLNLWYAFSRFILT